MWRPKSSWLTPGSNTHHQNSSELLRSPGFLGTEVSSRAPRQLRRVDQAVTAPTDAQEPGPGESHLGRHRRRTEPGVRQPGSGETPGGLSAPRIPRLNE